VLCLAAVLAAIVWGRQSPAAVGATMVEKVEDGGETVQVSGETVQEEVVGWGTVLALKETWILGLTLLCATLMLYPFFAGFGQFALENGVTKSQLANGSLALTVLFVVCAVVSGAVTTSMSKKMNPLKAQSLVVMTGFAIMVLGAILMALLGTKGGFLNWFISCVIFFPLGMGVMMPTFNVMPPLVFNPKVAGTGTGVVTFVGNIVNWATPGIWLGLVVTIGWKGYWLLIVPFMVIGFLLVLSIYRRA
jgi:MFS family permease